LERIVVSNEVKTCLNNLIDILYREEYFGFKESARNYVKNLLEDVYKPLHHKKHYGAPKQFMDKGKFFAIFKTSKNSS
jgi:hypothetical protein